jgi:hypothetical protein
MNFLFFKKNQNQNFEWDRLPIGRNRNRPGTVRPVTVVTNRFLYIFNPGGVRQCVSR